MPYSDAAIARFKSLDPNWEPPVEMEKFRFECDEKKFCRAFAPNVIILSLTLSIIVTGRLKKNMLFPTFPTPRKQHALTMHA